MVPAGGRSRLRAPVLAALSGALILGVALAGCSADQTADPQPSGDTKATQPLPGSSATTLTLGVVAGQTTNLALSLPTRRSGVSPDVVTPFTARLTGVGGRTVTTKFSPVDLTGSDPTQTIAAACTAQQGSSIVISDLVDPALVDCLIGQGALVIDISGQLWDSQALNQRAPFLWASATAAADVAERVLLAQAKRAGLLKPRTAVVGYGPDEVSRRVATSVTIPTLGADGIVPTQVVLRPVTLPTSTPPTTPAPTGTPPATPPPSTDGPPDLLTYVSGADAIVAAKSAIVRTVTPRLYPLTASTDGVADTDSAFLVTSADLPGYVVKNPQLVDATVGPATRVLGWSPVSDGLSGEGTEAAVADAQTAAACRTTAGATVIDTAVTVSWASVYRLCDAANLVALGLSIPGTPSAATFRDTVWSNGAQWRPAAVLADRWPDATFTGATRARWLTWNATCTLDAAGASAPATGCFAPKGDPLPVTQ